VIDDISAPKSPAQRIEVGDITYESLDGQSFYRPGVRMHQAAHRMALGNQSPHQIGTDMTGGTGNDDSHTNLIIA
jgi:hypothetical protein